LSDIIEEEEVPFEETDIVEEEIPQEEPGFDSDTFEE